MEFMVTKSLIPAARKQVVRSRRQGGILNDGMGRKLTLLCAPAGFGKTTLIASFCREIAKYQRTPVWLTLDEYDNALARFWFDVFSSFDRADHGLLLHEKLDLQEFAALDEAQLCAKVIAAINELAASRKSYYLVLDAYHVINEPRVAKDLTFFINGCPPNVSVAVTTRALPDLNIPFLRLQGELTELSIADMRLNRDETEYFFQEMEGLDYSAREIDALYEYTGGCVSMLQFAATNTCQGDDSSDEEERMAGKIARIHEMSKEYLLDEIIKQYDDQTKRFLACLSVLPKFNAPLCDAITQNNASRARISYLVEQGIIVPADASAASQWYRIADVYQEMLREYGHKTLSVHDVSTICDIAGKCFEDKDMVEDAIELALYLEDSQRFVSLITCYLDILLKRNDGATILRWVDRLSDEASEGNFAFLIASAWANFVAGRPEEASRWLHVVHANYRQDEAGQVDGGELYDTWLIVMTIEACCTSQKGDYQQGILLAQEALSKLNADVLLNRTQLWLWVTLWHNLGESYTRIGDFDRALEALNTCKIDCVMARRPMLYHMSIYEMGQIKMIRGDLGGARRLYKEGYKSVEEGLVESRWSMGFVYLGIAYIELLEGQVAEARSRYLQARKSFILAPNIDGYLDSMALKACVTFAEGCHRGAAAIIRDAYEEAMLAVVPRGIAEYVALIKMSIDSANGDLLSVETLLERHERTIPETDILHSLLFSICQARCLIKKGKPEKGLAILDSSRDKAEKAGLRLIIAFLEVYRLDALWELERCEEALDALMHLLFLSSSMGTTALFNLGGNLGKVLRKFLHGNEPVYARYRRENQYLAGAAEEALDYCTSVALDGQVNKVDPIDVLTAKEQEALTLLREGRTRREVSEMMGISQNTVKTHIRNIYRKMGIHGKTDINSILASHPRSQRDSS